MPLKAFIILFFNSQELTNQIFFGQCIIQYSLILLAPLAQPVQPVSKVTSNITHHDILFIGAPYH